MEETRGPFVVACLVAEDVIMPAGDEPPIIEHVFPNLARPPGVPARELKALPVFVQIAGG
jgi:hypothetical protein